MGSVQEMSTIITVTVTGHLKAGTEPTFWVSYMLTAQIDSVEEDCNGCNFLAASLEGVSSASSRNVVYISNTSGSGRYLQ
jgi:hypothetical protein